MVVHSSSCSSNQRRLLEPEEKSTTVRQRAQNYSPDNTLSHPTRLEYSTDTAARTPNPMSIYKLIYMNLLLNNKRSGVKKKYSKE
jgi:hypothetical protein